MTGRRRMELHEAVHVGGGAVAHVMFHLITTATTNTGGGFFIWLLSFRFK